MGVVLTNKIRIKGVEMRGVFESVVATGIVLALGVGVVTTKAWGAAQTRFISHRGESLEAPENTMASFRRAIERGADGFELDVYLTKDDKLICLHDSTAKRTGGLDVKPRDATLAELQALDAGSWKGPQFKGEKMPTLEEALTLARDNFEILVEVKCGVEIMPFLVAAIKGEPKATPKRIVFICFNSDVIAAIREQLPEYEAYWLSGTGPRRDGTPGPTAEYIIGRAKACNATGVDLQNSVDITAEYVKKIKEAGFSFHIWTVNDAVRARELAAMGVESITSDCGGTLKRLIYGGGGAREAVVHREVVSDTVVPWQMPLVGSVALWYKPESFYDFNTIFDHDANPDTWEMWIYKSGILRFRQGGNAVVSTDLSEAGGAGKWYHIAVSWDLVDKREIVLYLNGEEKDRAKSGSAWVTSGGNFYLGGGNPGNTRGKGDAAGLRLYDVVLSADEVKGLAEAGR